MSENDYDVGYRKPPKHTQFAKGKSGNPNGRKKGKVNSTQLLDKILAELIPITHGGKSKKVSRREAVMRQFINQAMKGNMASLKILLAHLSKKETEVEAKSQNSDEMRAIIRKKLLGSFDQT